MNREDLERLSATELVDMVVRLHQHNEQLQAAAGEATAPQTVAHESGEPPPQSADEDAQGMLVDEQLRRTSLLLQLSIEFRETLEPTVIVERMLHVMVSNMDVRHASVVLIGSDNSVDLAMSLRNGQVQQITSTITRAMLDRGLGGWALRQGRSVVLADVSRDKRWIPYEEWQATGSALVLPIRQAQMMLGVLTVHHPEPNHFTSRDMLLMEGVSAQAGVALGASRRYFEESRRREQALALLSMSQFLTAERSFDDLAAMMLEKSQSIFGVDYGFLFLSWDNRLLSLVGTPPGISGAQGKILVKQASMAARKAWEQNAIATESDAPENPRQSFMALPLVHSGTAIGAVVLVRTSGDDVAFSANMWSMLTTFTNVVATTCANMRLMEQLRQHSESLETMVDDRTRLLRRSRNLLRLMFDNLPDGLVLLDPQEVLLSANSMFCYRIVGRHPRDVVGENLPDIWEELEERGEVRIEMRHPMMMRQSAERGQRTMRVLCTAASGQQRWYEVTRIPVGEPEGEIYHYIEQWVDVTDQEELQRQLLLQDQRSILGHLTARVVHDISTPLQEVLGSLNLCQEDAALSLRVQECLRMAQDGLHHMDRMLKSLTQLYKSPRTTWECIDMNDLLEKVRELAAKHVSDERIEVVMELDSGLPPVFCQPDALRQVFLGMVFNAYEAMPEGGKVTMGCQWVPDPRGLPGGVCVVRIADTGVGMTDEQLSHLFEPFRSNKTRGMGMGLYLSKQIIEQHLGRLEVASRRREGTVIEVFLPWDDRCVDG
jgi:PAS domain S-box-containing protein